MPQKTDTLKDTGPGSRAASVRATKTVTRRTQRELAKLGLTVCLGVLAATGVSRSRNSRRWHVIAGTALVGLSVWHHLLYPSTKRDNR